MSTHVVTKTLTMGSGTLEPGTTVDASGWRNARLLEEQRYIKPVQPNERERRVGRKEKDGNNTRQ